VIESLSVTLDPSQVQAFDPWYYPVQVNGKAVTLGVGTKSSHDYLLQWQRYRDGVLGNPLLAKLDLKDKNLRDYAGNCGYWGLRAAERGLASYTCIEGRQVFIDQGLELWKQNNFTDCDYEFVHGNVDSVNIEQQQKTDISFCIGILYHLPDWQSLLRRVALSTNEALVVETRIHPGRMQPYPGDLTFNRITEMGSDALKLPTLLEIHTILDECGWVSVETLVNDNTPGPLVTAGELFNKGDVGRVALLARK
jgi:hypothetical protein